MEAPKSPEIDANFKTRKPVDKQKVTTDTFEAVNKWKREFLDQLGKNENDQFPFILVGNKVDLDQVRQVTQSEAQ